MLLCKIWASLAAGKTKTGDPIPGYGTEHPDLLVLWQLQGPKLWDDQRKVKYVKQLCLWQLCFLFCPCSSDLDLTGVLNLKELQAQNSKGVTKVSGLDMKEHLLFWDLQQRFKRCWVNSQHTFCALEQVNHLTCVGSELLIYKREHCYCSLLLLDA